MIAEEKRVQIETELDALEAEEGVTILWACESGSRAWGFESRDSDYDVRFIYLRRTSDYLRVSPLRDVIEKPISADLDISGWDLPKALGLFRKSNPPLLEWLQSPVVYRQDAQFHAELAALVPEYLSAIGCMYHYLSMAKRDLRSCQNDQEIKLKKYFYLLRPVLSCMWIEQGLGVPPIELRGLLNRILPDGALREQIDALIEQKKQATEKDTIPRIPMLSNFIIEQMAAFRAVTQQASFTSAWGSLDALFRATLLRVNGPGFEAAVGEKGIADTADSM